MKDYHRYILGTTTTNLPYLSFVPVHPFHYLCSFLMIIIVDVGLPFRMG